MVPRLSGDFVDGDESDSEDIDAFEPEPGASGQDDDDDAAKHPIGSDDLEGRPDVAPKSPIAPTPKGGTEDKPDPHVEKALDHGIEETFPASDPVSISPGAD